MARYAETMLERPTPWAWQLRAIVAILALGVVVLAAVIGSPRPPGESLPFPEKRAATGSRLK